MQHLPPFIAPSEHQDAESALAQIQHIYQHSVNHLRLAMREFVAGADMAGTRVRAFYPFVRVQVTSANRKSAGLDSRLSYGFVAEPGRFETTLTRPDLFAYYIRQQLTLLLQNHGVSLQVGTSNQPIPIHFSFADDEHMEGSLSR